MPKKSSAPRKWCKVCKIWIADNRIQREQHEQAKKHKEALQALLKDIAEKNEQKSRTASAANRNEYPHLSEKVSTVAEEMLERVAQARGETMRASFDERREAIGEKDIEEATVKGESKGELVDGNGYPLPANVIYGAWETVEDVVDTETHIECADESAERKKAHADITTTDKNESTLDCKEDDMPSKTKVEEGQEWDMETKAAFKRRTAPSNRRVRKKARR